MCDDSVLWAARARETLAETKLPPLPPPLGVALPAKPPGLLAPFVHLVDRLARRLDGELVELPTFADGVAVQAVLDAIRRSWAGGGWVTV